jgi:hypothetical protein
MPKEYFDLCCAPTQEALIVLAMNNDAFDLELFSFIDKNIEGGFDAFEKSYREWEKT